MKRRKGLAILDATIGLAVLSTALLIAAQTTMWLVGERQQVEVRQQAVEATANVLEAARACNWDDLDSKWAEGQRLPASMAERCEDADLAVRVQPEAGRDQIKRVSVELTWKQPDGRMATPVRVTALFARRTGGKP
jgi:hypothetical protein